MTWGIHSLYTLNTHRIYCGSGAGCIKSVQLKCGMSTIIYSRAYILYVGSVHIYLKQTKLFCPNITIIHRTTNLFDKIYCKFNYLHDEWECV